MILEYELIRQIAFPCMQTLRLDLLGFADLVLLLHDSTALGALELAVLLLGGIVLLAPHGRAPSEFQFVAQAGVH